MFFTTDLHIHSDYPAQADRLSVMRECAAAARENGLETIGFSEHYWNRAFPGKGRYYEDRGPETLREIREAVRMLQEETPLKILTGCESEYGMDGTIPLTEEDLSLLDYVVVPHSHLNYIGVTTPHDYTDHWKECAEYMVQTFRGVTSHPLADRITVLAHPFEPVGYGEHQNEILRWIPDTQFRECVREAQDKGIALEINSLTVRGFSPEELVRSEWVRFYTIAREEGCTFVYGSDLHGTAQFAYKKLAETVAGEAGITDEMMLQI